MQQCFVTFTANANFNNETLCGVFSSLGPCDSQKNLILRCLNQKTQELNVDARAVSCNALSRTQTLWIIEDANVSKQVTSVNSQDIQIASLIKEFKITCWFIHEAFISKQQIQVQLRGKYLFRACFISRLVCYHSKMKSLHFKLLLTLTNDPTLKEIVKIWLINAERHHKSSSLDAYTSMIKRIQRRWTSFVRLVQLPIQISSPRGERSKCHKDHQTRSFETRDEDVNKKTF